MCVEVSGKCRCPKEAEPARISQFSGRLNLLKALFRTRLTSAAVEGFPKWLIFIFGSIPNVFASVLISGVVMPTRKMLFFMSHRPFCLQSALVESSSWYRSSSARRHQRGSCSASCIR